MPDRIATARQSREELIRDLEARRLTISKTIGGLFGEENAAAHRQYQQISRRLGALLLQRDKEQRPEVYRRALDKRLEKPGKGKEASHE